MTEKIRKPRARIQKSAQKTKETWPEGATIGPAMNAGPAKTGRQGTGNPRTLSPSEYLTPAQMTAKSFFDKLFNRPA